MGSSRKSFQKTSSTEDMVGGGSYVPYAPCSKTIIEGGGDGNKGQLRDVELRQITVDTWMRVGKAV